MVLGGSNVDRDLDRLGAAKRWLTMLEVVVFRGDLMVEVLEKYPLLHYIGVDPYWYDPYDSGRYTNDVAQLREAKKIARERQQKYGMNRRASLLRMPSLVALWEAPIDIDLVHLTGEQRETAVVLDLLAWSKKVRPGGILCGHNWGMWDSVNSAVTLCRDRWFPDWEFDTCGNTWALIRPAEPGAFWPRIEKTPSN